VRVDFKKIPLVHDRVNRVADVVGLVGGFGDERVEA
jgi:hypothetical protein